MANTPIKTVVANTAPPMLLTLERDGVGIDVTGCTCTLKIVASDGTVTNAGSALTLVTPAWGIVQFTPIAGDFPSAGTYKTEAKIAYAGGAVEKLYNIQKFKVRAGL